MFVFHIHPLLDAYQRGRGRGDRAPSLKAAASPARALARDEPRASRARVGGRFNVFLETADAGDNDDDDGPAGKGDTAPQSSSSQRTAAAKPVRAYAHGSAHACARAAGCSNCGHLHGISRSA